MNLYTQHISGCFSDIIGDAGIDKADFEEITCLLKPIIASLLKEGNEGKLPLLSITSDKDDLKELRHISDDMRARFDSLVVLGTGGSILNPEAICALKRNIGDKSLFFADTIDPIVFESRLAQLDIKRTAFLAISKSGNTLETISQTLICLELSRKALGNSFNSHWFIITDPYANPLRNLAEEINATLIDHPEGIGGRYSGLTSVGLLPAAFAGLDIVAIRQGADKVIQNLRNNIEKSHPAQSAALYYGFLKKNISLSVMLPYIARLGDFTTWYSQIVAESLGKNSKGITPIRAIGPLDQHSQLQLFLDGPKDKFITIISQSHHNSNCTISQPYEAIKSFDYLEGKNLQDVLCAEQQATIETLRENNRPLRHIAITTLNEEVIGGLMMQMMLEVILTAKLMNINPFDQPAVEQGKIRTRNLLGAKT